MTRCLLISMKNVIGLLALIYFGGILTTCSEDVSWCDERLSKLKKDVQDWQKRCLNETQREIISACCKAEEDYFKKRMHMHTEMCFFSGDIKRRRI